MKQAMTNVTTSFQFGKLAEMPYWSNWAIFIVAIVAILTFSWWWSRRDTHAQSPLTRYVLFGLRAASLVGILFFFLNLEKRTQREVRENSRVAVLIDTSQSMGLANDVSASSTESTTRSEKAIELVSKSELVENLRQRHNVSVMTFDDTTPPRTIAFYERAEKVVEVDIAEGLSERYQQQWDQMVWTTWIGLGVSVLGIVCLITGGVLAGSRSGPIFHLTSAVLILGAVLAVAVADLMNDQLRPWQVIAGDHRLQSEPKVPQSQSTSITPDNEPSQQIDWNAELRPTGVETRIGDAIVQLVNQERGGPFSGILLVSDGANNEGVEIDEAIQITRGIGARIVTVGLGSDQQPQSVRVVDIEAPAKAFPGDPFQLRGYIQGLGLPNKMITLQVASGKLDQDGKFIEESIDVVSDPIQLGEDGEVIPVDFQITPDELGERAYQLRVINTSETDIDTSDNDRVVKVQIVQQRSRVMLLAGGPTREFRFLRNQLYRDKDIELDVLLQTGQPGISQESDRLLFEFPTDPNVLFEEYDCIIAFDPDWSQLTIDQVQLLERWIGEKAGGLVIIAGPIFTPEWASLRRGNDAIDIIKDLHPVTFYSRGTSIGLGRFGSKSPQKVLLTSQGQAAGVNQLDDSPDVSLKLWQKFAGIFGYFTVRGAKPGASVWAEIQSETGSIDGSQPIYMASHFYGAGRVTFLGSGEIWRMRSLDVGLFETFYTNLIRYSAQGRLARDSSRGLLLVSSQRVSLGETVEVRGFFTDPQHNPMTDPLVEGRLILPDGTQQPLVLRQMPEFERGQYAGQFTVLQDGLYRVEVQLLGGGEDSLLSRELRARIPDIEISKPRRDDAILTAISGGTGGKSIVGIDAMMDPSKLDSLVGEQVLPSRDMFTSLPDLVDRQFQEALRLWLLVWMATALSVEWIQRRFVKLA